MSASKMKLFMTQLTNYSRKLLSQRAPSFIARVLVADSETRFRDQLLHKDHKACTHAISSVKDAY